MKEGWNYRKIGDVLTVERGGSPRPIKKYLTDSADGLNWIKISDATASDKYIYETKQKITKDGLHKTRVVNEGDFLLSNSMSFGRPYIMKTTGCIHDGWLVLREKQEHILDKDFLYYLLGSPYIFEQFDTLAAGSTVRNLNISLVSSVSIPIPPLESQRKIVAVLDEAFAVIDKAKANVERNIENSRELFQSKLNEVFSQKGEGWEEKSLGEVCEIKGGGTPSKKNESYWGGDIPWVSPKDMKFRNISTSQDFITQEGVDKSSTKLIPEGSLLIVVRSGILSHTIPLGVTTRDVTINQDLKALMFNSGIDVDFAYYQLQGKENELLARISKGATVHRLVSDLLTSLPFNYPDLETQQSIKREISKLSKLLKSQEESYLQKLHNLESLKKSILQKAFAGESV